jgi:error-prone DNA polymerase
MYVELHARSAFSFLDATALPEQIAEQAARLEQSAIALLDTDGVYGAPRLYRACTRLGLTPLVGAEVTLAGGGRLPLLAEDREGYKNLCRLLTRIKMRAPKGQGAAALDDLAEHAAGLVCLTGGDHGPVAARLERDGPESARALVDRLMAIYGRFNVYVELQRHLSRAEEARNDWLRRLAERLHVPLLATNEPRLIRREDRPLLDVLTAIREHTTVDAAGRLLARNSERFMKSGAAMQRLFADCPDAVANTGELALRLGFTLKHLGYQFPDYPLPRGQTPMGLLRALSEAGAHARYGSGPLAERARRQIERELALIGRLDLAGYFLIVWDLVRYCRDSGILVQGRGSAANSAVCYALGITAVDPVGMDLLFERFLSEERGEWPDIDLDLPSGDRRERVIQYVYERYGRLGAAMTANVITYRGRSAAREVGKALGLPADLVERLSQLVSDWEYKEPGDTLTAHLGEAGGDPDDLRIRHFARLWTAIQDLPRHLGQHSGGMVICQGRLDGVVPLEPATMAGRSVVQWDKDDCAALGIVKVDLLGLGMMALLQDALEMIERGGGSVDLAHLPQDPRVYAMLQEADTIGVFQVESRAQMATLPRLRPERFYDLVVQVAIIRPGPIVGDMVHPYLRRRAGREAPTVPHPDLAPILERTLGVPLFQEQLLRMAMVTAGFSGGEAEELRRAFGFKRSERAMQAVEEKLRAGMARRGIVGAQAESIVHSITAFALYGFPECVAGETRVIDADSGRWVRIEDIVSGRRRVKRTLACDGNLTIRTGTVLGATASGSRMVHRVRTALGRELLATAEHPLLTMDGWRPLAGLEPGDHIAGPRALPPLGRTRWLRHQLIALAALLAGGHACPAGTCGVSTTSARYRDEFVRAVEEFDNTRATVARRRSGYGVHVRGVDPSRPIGAVEWAKRLELWGIGARAKRLPPEVLELRAGDLAFLLARLWEGGGGRARAGHARYHTASRQLADQVQHILLRLGIAARLSTRARPARDGRAAGFVVTIAGGRHLRRFHRVIARRFLDQAKCQAIERILAMCGDGRASRNGIPPPVRTLIDRVRRGQGVTWDELTPRAHLSGRAICSPDAWHRGDRRRTIARSFGWPEAIRLAPSDLHWDRVVAVEPVGERETYDLHVEEHHNFIANDLVVHNSHAASFALLAYASAYLKTHQPAAFYAALLNNQPMGFYHPATIVRDAQRHGQVVRPADVNRSDWLCAIEPDGAVRIGLRYVRGLRETVGKQLEGERTRAPFASVADLVRRVALRHDELVQLARVGALASLEPERRAALWSAERAGRPAGALYEDLPEPVEPSPLPAMTPAELLIADYDGTGLSVGPHPMEFHRARLDRMRVAPAARLARLRHGAWVKVAGAVIVRQRPGTAKGFVFLNLEDETGLANVIVRPALFARHRLLLVREPFLLVEGTLQHQDNVISVRAERIAPLKDATRIQSHDFR